MRAKWYVLNKKGYYKFIELIPDLKDEVTIIWLFICYRRGNMF